MFDRGHADGFTAALKMGCWFWVIIFSLPLAARAQDPEMRLSPRKVREEVRMVVEAQLTALREGDFAAAYGFAATGIKRQFDIRLFSLMIKRGYPALLRHEKSDLGLVRDDAKGTAQLSVTVIDGLNRRTTYSFWLGQEQAGWRISGVVPEQTAPSVGI